MAAIFLSYKTEDQDRVAPLVAALRAAGLDTWWDEDIPAGGHWRETIARELDSAALCVVAWSENSTGAGGRFVREEAERAAARGAYLGVLIDPVLPPFGFAEWQAIDLSEWNGRKSDPLLAHFVGQVRARLENRPVPAAAADSSPRRRRRPAAWAIGGAAAALAVIGLLAFWLLSRADPPPPADTPTAFVNRQLGGTACSWLQISSVTPDPRGGERIELAGIAASPDAVQAGLIRESVAAGVALADIGVDEVAAGPSETCAELELLRTYRWTGRSRLSILPPRGALRHTQYGWSGRFEFEVNFGALPPHVALLGLDSIGGVEVLIPDLQAFRREARALRSDGPVSAYEGYFFDENEGARNVGLILMTATGPIDTALVEAIGSRADRDFLTRIGREAIARGWKFELALVRCGFEGSSARRQC